MVILITGANGQLGQAIRAIAPEFSQFSFCFADSHKADITQKQGLVRVFEQVKPDIVINAAAYTAVDKAESEPEKADLINHIGARNIAEVCADFSAKLIHVSTDFVFDGTKKSPYTEQDKPNPQSVYGATKLDGERAVLSVLPGAVIVRTSWVYSPFGHNFMKTMLRLAQERDELSVVNDQMGTPTNAIDLARTLLLIADAIGRNSKHDFGGIYHFSNEGACSWHDFAKKIFELQHISIKVNAIPTSQFPTPAKRPSYSVLDKRKIKEVFGVKPQAWEVGLQEALSQLSAQ